MNELIAAFAERPKPASGIVSRSRLRHWFFSRGGDERDWGAFVRALVARRLWTPWHGIDLALAEGKSTRPVGYRLASPTPLRHASFAAMHPGELFLPALIACLGIGFMLTRHGQWFGAILLVLAAVDFSFTLRRMKKCNVEISHERARVTHGRRVHDLALANLLWVDVVRRGSRRTQTQVVAMTKAGEKLILTDMMHPRYALSLCRTIESAMIEAAALELANRTKVRVAPAVDSHEIPEPITEEAAEA